MKKKVLGAVFALALSASGAYGADMSDTAHDWSGPYLGVHGGLALLEGTLSFSPVAAGPGTRDMNGTGWAIGGHAGWNWQHDIFVLGLEGDLDYVDVDDSKSFTSVAGTAIVGSDYDWFGTIRARAGMANDDLLIYATGGIAFLGHDLSASDPAGAASDEDTLFGFTIGGGIEYRLSENWRARGEYLYADFEKHSVSIPVGPARAATARPDLHLLRFGISYYFCTGGSC